MPQKKYKPDEIVAKLWQVDVLVSQGQSVAEGVRTIDVTQFTYYRWRKEYGGLTTNQVIRIDRRLRSTDVIDVLSDQFNLRGVPDHIRSGDGPEFVATAIRDWIAAVCARTAYIEPGSPWENGHCESFNAKLRDELLNGEIFYSLAEARIVIEGWRKHYNTKRPHSSLDYRPPVPEVVQWPAPPSGAASPATTAVAARSIMHKG